MRNAKWATVSLVGFCCLLVVLGIFALWLNSGLVDKAFGQRNPRVFVIGDMDKMPLGLKGQMPPGFTNRPFREWSPEIDTEDALIEFGPLENPGVMFTIYDDTENVDEFMEWARDHGKEEVYFLYPPPRDPDIPIVPEPELIDHLFSSASEAVSWFIEALRIPITPAYANSVPSYTCTTGTSIPVGYTYAICSSTPGLCYFRMEFRYSAKTCHTDPYWVHSRTNVFLHDWSTSKGWRDAMNHLNGYPNTYTAGFIGQLIELRAKMYKLSTEVGAAVPQCCSNCCGCGQQPLPSSGPPYTSNDKTIWIAAKTSMGANCNLNSWTTIRHEVAHTFGFGHCDMDANLFHVREAWNGRGAANGIISPSGGSCPTGYKGCDYDFINVPGDPDFCKPDPATFPLIKSWVYF